MTSQGHAYTQLKRALASGNASLALATASELPQVALADALEICLLLRDQDPKRFERAAIRWHARLCREAPLSMDEAQLALIAMRGLDGRAARAGAHGLLAILELHGLTQVTRVLDRWLEGMEP